MLQGIIDETVRAIRRGERKDGSTYPIQSFVAAKQLLGHYDLTSIEVQERLLCEMVQMQDEHEILRDAQQLVNTSLVDFVAKAAEQQMGAEYERLKQSRFDPLSMPSAE